MAEANRDDHFGDFLLFPDRAQALAHPVCACGAPRQPKDGVLDMGSIPPRFMPVCTECKAEADHPSGKVSGAWMTALMRQWVARGLL